MYGVWKEKNMYGRRTWGVARTTFWIGPDGRIKKIYKKVDTAHTPRTFSRICGRRGRSLREVES